MTNELSNLQFKNHEILKESMASNFEIGRLAENTNKYLNSYSIDLSQENTSKSANISSEKPSQDISCIIKNVNNPKIITVDNLK